MASDALVTVAVCHGYPAAATAQSALEAEGVSVTVVGGGFASLDWHMLPALGGIEIRTSAGDAERARARLAGETPPLRESRAFWAAPIRNAATFFLVLYVAGVAVPFWIRRTPATDIVESA
ncbi:hypothetical protein JOD31_003632 [Methylopila capsulata]|uniref:DUF2007 domain-containing protein n=1 Tax=Methylopila capsulata TaxID=61654 RepID=A0ABS2TCG6_9HYPH|nr:hypothetical protein [Methylopila capsulata]MBM7853371.1 hypothetical protein [Methylopila capsulata]